MSDALLVLEDGTWFAGRGFGATGEAFGEAVFNTGMSGYQEVLTDPSYAAQIVTMTSPMIGRVMTGLSTPARFLTGSMEIAPIGHTGTQFPQATHFCGSIRIAQ